MGIPTGVAVGPGASQFDKADAALNESPGYQALPAIRAGVFGGGV